MTADQSGRVLTPENCATCKAVANDPRLRCEDHPFAGRVRSSAEIRGDALLNGRCPLCFAGVQAHKPNRSWSCPFDRRTLRVLAAEFAEQVANRDVIAPARVQS